jgi:NDP-sugar pyrophosphorylase family protein
MNIIIPMAGNNTFNSADYFYPKPLIDVGGLPLIQYVTENLQSIEGDNKFIYIIREEEATKFHLDNTLKLLTPNCEVIILKNETKGAVCSILFCIDQIDKEEEMIVVNADQVFYEDINPSVNSFRSSDAAGGVITFDSVHPRWSYAITDENNDVIQTVEKNPVSRNAIAGFYYFKSFNLFKEAAFKSLYIEDFLDGQLYTSTLLNQLILQNLKVGSYKVSSSNYKSFYSPQKIKEFENYLANQNKITI